MTKRYPFKAEVRVFGYEDCVGERVWLTDWVEGVNREDARARIDAIAAEIVDEHQLVDFTPQRAEVLSVQWNRYER